MPADPIRVFKRDSKWRRGVIRNQASAMIVHGFIRTNLPRAKVLRSEVERLITLGKDGSLTARRKAAQTLRPLKTSTGEDVLTYLFNTLAPRFKERAGGYTRIVRLMPRRGDAVQMAILEFVE